ncbi:hypothetical protein ACVXHB_01755 [Escherichia coli]
MTNPCGELDEQHVEHARKQLEEAKARVQAQRAEHKRKNAKLPQLLVRRRRTAPRTQATSDHATPQRRR